MSVTAPAPRLDSAGKRNDHTLVGTAVGTALEWFDWSIYGTFAAFFAANFFASTEAAHAFQNTWWVFFIGFLARPIGGFFFGRIADTRGRRTSMILTSAFAGVGSLIIGIAPSHMLIGVFAVVLLLLGRFVQGLAHGGEQPAAQAYLAEAAPPDRRGLWSTLIYTAGTLGANLGILLAALLSTWLGAGGMVASGWRIAFIVGFLGSMWAVWTRYRMPETQTFAEAADRPKVDLWAEIVRSRVVAVKVIGMTAGLTVSYYLFLVVVSGYSIAVLGADPTATLWTGFAMNFFFVALLPVWGLLSDRIGRRPVMLIGTLGMALVTLPLLGFIDGSWQRLAITLAVAYTFLTAPCAISPAYMAELVPTRIRTIGVGFPMALATAIFGGTAGLLQSALAARYHSQTPFAIYVIALLLASAAIVWSLPETRGKDLADEDAPSIVHA